MLVWLASYPRSGNTLLRQLLWQTMGVQSYNDAPPLTFTGEWALDLDPEFGALDALHDYAASRDDAVLVKTHLPPADNERAIYVVRDGRSAIVSFLNFERLHATEAGSTLLGLILGEHFYGHWARHVTAWRERSGETLFVRFADLRAGNPATLAQLANFVGYRGEIGAWMNRFETYRATAPQEFGEGHATWVPTPEWDWVADTVFWNEHGDVMAGLGFDDGRRAAAGHARTDSLLELAREVQLSRTRLNALAVELETKETLIQKLERERVRQAVELDTKEELIHELDRERMLQAAAARERASVIERLAAKVDELQAWEPDPDFAPASRVSAESDPRGSG